MAKTSPRIQSPPGRRFHEDAKKEAFVQQSEDPAAAPTKPKPATTRLTLDLPDEVYMRLKVKAALGRQTMVSIVRQLLEDHL